LPILEIAFFSSADSFGYESQDQLDRQCASIAQRTHRS